MFENETEKTVFFITIDALRADHLKQYGYSLNTAPYLDKFIKQGSTFNNAYTNGPATPSSFSAIFTSILPLLNGGYSPLPIEKITFPQLLKKKGIFNYGIHSNPNLGAFFNYNRGFDIFLDGERYKIEKDRPNKKGIRYQLIYVVKKIFNYKNFSRKLIYRFKGFNRFIDWIRTKFPFITDILLPFTPMSYNATYIINKIISFLNTHKGPLFMWAHFMETHGPYNPPSKNVLNLRRFDIDSNEREYLSKEILVHHQKYKISSDTLDKLTVLYDGEINFCDENLRYLFEYINYHFKKNTLIIITSDHGESLYEHGLLGHQGSVYQELLRVPLFIVEKGVNTNLNYIKEKVELIDIAPTILDYFGIEIPEWFQGKSLIPLMKGVPQKRDDFIISACYQKNRFMKRNPREGFLLISIQKAEWKYIFDEELNQEYLFDLQKDPNENTNLVNINREKANEFRLIKQYHLIKSQKTDEKYRISSAISKLKPKLQ